MEKTSYRLIKILEENARYSVAELAQMIDLSEEETAALMKKLESEKEICGYKALIDWDKFSDTHITALIELKVTPQNGAGFEEMAEYIMNMPEVESVYLMSGAYDFSVTVQGRSFKDVALFVAKRLATMRGVVSTATHFVLRRYKELSVQMIKMQDDDRGTMSF